MNLLTNFGLYILSLALLLMLYPLGIIYQLTKFTIKLDLNGMSLYFRHLALANDQVGATVLYNTVDWTVSSYTYILHLQNNIYASSFMIFIDTMAKLLGDDANHCKISYHSDLAQHLKGGV